MPIKSSHAIPEGEDNNPLREKLSRVIQHAAIRKRRSLFRRLTKGHKKEISVASKRPPRFYAENPEATQRIELEPEIAGLMPPEFFDHPTQWIESQPNIQRGHILPNTRSIQALWKFPYDISKVKEIQIGGTAHPISLVSKRIEKGQEDQVELARRAYEAGIPTAKILGEVEDQGNHYAFFEKLPGKSLLAIIPEDFWYDPPYWCINEREFRRNSPVSKYIKSDVKIRLHKLWRDYISTFTLNELNMIIGFPEQFGYEKIHEEWITGIKKSIENRGFQEDDLKKAWEFIGFSSFENFVDSLPLDIQSRGSRQMEIHQKILAFTENRIEEYKEKSFSIVQTAFFGLDLKKELERLEELCEEKGVLHKDLENRNLILEWDLEQDKPIKGRTPKLWIIDWEKESPSALLQKTLKSETQEPE